MYKIVAIQPSTPSGTRFGGSAPKASRCRPRLGCGIGPVSCRSMDWSVSLAAQAPKLIAAIMAHLGISL